MAVEAMVTLVQQKLTDLLNEESVCRHKVIVHQLKAIEKSLETMRVELREAEGKPKTEQQIAEQRTATRYLRIVYTVEHEIERFAFRLARQSKSKGFLRTNHTPFFFNNFNAFRRLQSKMKRTVSGKSIYDDDDEDASSITNSKLGHQSRSINYDNPARENDDDHPDGIAELHEHRHTDTRANSTSQVHTTSINNRSSVPGPWDDQTLSSGCYSEGEEVVDNLLGFKDKSLKRQSSFSDREEEFRQTYGFRAERLKHPKKMSSFSYGEEELGIFGFKEDVDKLVKRLKRKGDRVVPIFGAVGSGKTTLARAIYRRRYINFQCGAWVSVLEDYTEADILRSLLKQLNDSCSSNSKDQGDLISEQLPQLKSRLFEMLKEKKYLVVLDDLHNFNLWEEIKEDLPDTKNGSKIIFTTCHDHPNLKIQRDLPHNLNGLSEQDSWDLFLKKADNPSSLPPAEVKQKILETCKGRPLYIVLIGGLLSTKQVKDWSSSAPLSGDNSDIFWLCYNDLPVHYKLCLLYLVLFPKQLDIPVRRLLRLWLAEGFVDRLVESSSPDRVPVREDVVLECFKNLVNRNMIQISKLRSDNGPRKCYLIGALHDYLLPKALEISLFYVHRNLDYNEEAAGPFGIRRMVEYADIKGVFGKWPMENNEEQRRGENTCIPSISCFCFSSGMQQSQRREGIKSLPSRSSISSVDPYENFPLNPSCLLSYLSFNLQKKDTPAIEVGRFLSRIISNGFGLLRVLDLEGVYKPSLPHKLGDLHNLRYLGLRWTFLDALPQSVGDLPYLETLDVKHTYINEIPNSIWKAKHLRHLNLNGIRLDMPEAHPGSNRTLLTLWGLFVDEKSLVRNGLDRLVGLRELGISFHLTSSQSDLFCWIETLTALQSLRLRSKDDRGRPSTLDWAIPASRLENLSNLNLLGNLQKLPELPQNLKVLTLSVSQLKEDPMPTLGRLPSLTVLRLLANSYLGSKMVCPPKTFPRLKVLKLWMLKELTELDVGPLAMQNLEELNIRCCDKLKDIPLTLLWPTLQELILTNMPEDFVNRLNTIWLRNSSQTSLTVHTDWEFTPLPWEEEGSDDNTESDASGVQAKSKWCICP